jgi:carbonic anhydrase/acetyltransferase-like protein (isoleucine patch superfamily)
MSRRSSGGASLGSGAVILGGVTVGGQALVGAGAVVTRHPGGTLWSAIRREGPASRLTAARVDAVGDERPQFLRQTTWAAARWRAPFRQARTP